MNEINVLTVAINKAVKNGSYDAAAEVVHIFQALQVISQKVQELEKIKQNGSAA